jgi:hypothetical protein
MTLNWTAHLLWYLSTLRSRVPLKVVLEIKLPEKSQVSGFDNERKGFVVRTCCSNRTDATVGHQKISPMPRADQLTHILFPHTLAMSSLQLQVQKNSSQSMWRCFQRHLSGYLGDSGVKVQDINFCSPSFLLLWMKIPPDGEFPIMNYRMTQEFKPPFKVYPVIEEAGPFKVHLHENILVLWS